MESTGSYAREIENFTYGMRRRLGVSLPEALERTRAALASEGFGVLFEIDMKQKFEEKLGVDFGEYRIIGACNPKLAYGAIQEELDLGLLLPCNLAVYEAPTGMFVAAINAEKMMSVVGNDRISGVAAEVSDILRRVIEKI